MSLSLRSHHHYSLFLSVLISILFSNNIYANKAKENLATKWRVLDSKSGIIESVIEFREEEDGTFSGYVVKSKPNPLINQPDICEKCPYPFKDKPIVGMRVIWGLKVDGDSGLKFKDGYAFDPKNGKIYRGKLRISPDYRRMLLRGYIGTSVLGRTEVWLRGDGELTDSLGK